jgi:diadenylate cyclase
MELIKLIWNNYLRHIIDILIVAYILYRLILFIKGTRALQVLFGIIILAIITVFTKEFVHLNTLNWLLEKFWVVGMLIIAIVFQPELRSGLAQLGATPVANVFLAPFELEFIKKLIPAIRELSAKKNGALIVIEQETKLGDFISTGIILDAQISREIILSIFYPGSILHDGAIIMNSSRIIAAGCILPISENPIIDKKLGTRHRAGIGISEVSDAIGIIVSEETGSVSLTYQGKIEYNISFEELQRRLTEIIKQKIEKLLLHHDKSVQN